MAGLTEEIVVSAEQAIALVSEGESRRSVGATDMNACSSRSHAVFRVVCETRSASGVVRVGAMNLVDLAGSERLARTKAEGARRKEGTLINRSLLTLGTVIRKLSAGGAPEHVPYRDSLLTRILQPALGGNSKTAVVCAVSPAVINADESLSTLKFASQAKLVKNSASVNEVADHEALLARYKSQLGELSAELASLRANKKNENDANDLAALQAQLAQREDEINRMRALIVTSKSMEQGGKTIMRETWCAGVDGDYSIMMPGHAMTDDMLAQLVLADSENRITPKKKMTKSQKNNNGKKRKEEEEAAAAVAKRVSELESALSDAQELQEALEEENASLDGKLKAQGLKSEGAELELEEARERVALLVEAVQSSEDQMIDLRREMEMLRGTTQQLEARRQSAETAHEELEQRLTMAGGREEALMKAAELELEVTALKWERESSRTDREEQEKLWESEREQMQQIHQTLKSELEECATRETALEKEVEERERRATEAESRAERAEERTRMTERSGRSRAEKLEGMVASLQQEIGRGSEERLVLETRLRAAEEAGEEEAKASASQMKGLSETVRSISSVREKIKALGGKEEAENAAPMPASSSSSSSSSSARVQELESELERVQARQRQRLLVLESELGQMEAEAEHLQERVSQLEAEAEAGAAQHTLELERKDRKLVQLKELAMSKARQKIGERDAIIVRLKKEKARLQQERDSDVDGLVRQHRSELEELHKQLLAKTEAVRVMRDTIAELETVGENSMDAAAALKAGRRKEALMKLHTNF